MTALGFTQAELARRVGVKQPTIFKLIHENKSGSRNLHLIARELETTPAYLTGETDDPAGEWEPQKLTAEERDWLDWLRAAAPADRKALAQLAKTIAGSASSSAVRDKQHTHRATG